jgi:hypothetical protein
LRKQAKQISFALIAGKPGMAFQKLALSAESLCLFREALKSIAKSVQMSRLGFANSTGRSRSVKAGRALLAFRRALCAASGFHGPSQKAEGLRFAVKPAWIVYTKKRGLKAKGG